MFAINLNQTNLDTKGDKHFDALVQKGHNSSVLAMELRLSCTNPSNWDILTEP